MTYICIYIFFVYYMDGIFFLAIFLLVRASYIYGLYPSHLADADQGVGYEAVLSPPSSARRAVLMLLQAARPDERPLADCTVKPDSFVHFNLGFGVLGCFWMFSLVLGVRLWF